MQSLQVAWVSVFGSELERHKELGLGLGTFKVKDQGRILDLIRFIQGSVHRTVSL